MNRGIAGCVLALSVTGGLAYCALALGWVSWQSSFPYCEIHWPGTVIVLEAETNDTEPEGEQTEDDAFIVESDVPEVSEGIDISELGPVEDPFAAPANLEVVPLETGTMAISDLNAPSGMPLSGREAGMKEALLRKHGGREPSQNLQPVPGKLKKKSSSVQSPHGILDAPQPGNSPQQETDSAGD
ncbi:MAG: hypothetical protein N2C14_06975 [Planctomycetales bacterium]